MKDNYLVTLIRARKQHSM